MGLKTSKEYVDVMCAICSVFVNVLQETSFSRQLICHFCYDLPNYKPMKLKIVTMNKGIDKPPDHKKTA